MFPALALLAGALVAIILLFLLWTYSYWYRKGVSQGNPFKLFRGNDFTLSGETYVTLYKTTYNKNKKYPFHGVYQLLKPSLFLCDPELIKDVMLNKARVFPDTGSQIDDDVDPIVSGDPFFQTGQKWKDGRARFSALATPARLRALLPYLLEITVPLNDYTASFRHQSGRGDGADVKELVSKYVTDSLVSVLLGGKANSFSSEENIFQEIGKAVFEDNFTQNMAMLMIIGAPHLARILKLRLIPKKSCDLLSRIIKDEAFRRNQNGVVRHDIFHALLKKSETWDEGYVNKTVIPTIITFYIESFESSNLVATFTLLNLAQYPDIQDALREEIREKSPPGTKLNDAAVLDNKLLNNCILESMRLYPPVTLLSRKTSEDYTLKASTGEEVFLEKGTSVSIPIAGLNQDERVFPNPGVYDPDRFEDPQQRRHFLGFGDGPRQCLGQRYAQQAISVLVASLVRDFQVEIGTKMEFPLKFSSHPFFLYPADGVWLRFVPIT